MRLVFIACALALSAGAAQAKSAKCEMTIDGKTYINGKCKFESDKDGSFRIFADDYFAYLNKDGKQMRGSWNGEYKESHAHDSLGMLNRDGACWVNERARVCAW